MWPENMGAPFYIFRASPLGKETALHMSRVPIWTPWARLYKTVSTQQVVSGCCAACMDAFFLDCHELPVLLGLLEMIHSYLGKFRHF